MKNVMRLFAALLVTLPLAACNQAPTEVAPVAALPAPTLPAAPHFQLAASVQELMHDFVDPSADAVWDSVGTTITAKGIVDRQPKTAEEWQKVRAHAVLLIEATNLLAMEGRRLVPAGAKVLDEGNEGVLNAEEGQKRLQTQRQMFLQFDGALRDAGEHMLNAIDAKNPKAMLDIGAEMDGVCESCHTTFWYPNQVYPSLKNGITTLEALRASNR